MASRPQRCSLEPDDKPQLTEGGTD
jgi:hypothetical protein